MKHDNYQNVEHNETKVMKHENYLHFVTNCSGGEALLVSTKGVNARNEKAMSCTINTTSMN